MGLNIDQQRAAETLAKLTLDAFVRKDQLVWSQVQTLAVVQGGTLAAIYAVKSLVITTCVGLIGATVTLGIFLFAFKAIIERDLNSDIFDCFASALARQMPEDFFENMRSPHVDIEAFDISRPVRLYYPMRNLENYRWIMVNIFGRRLHMPMIKLGLLLYTACFAFIVLDLVAIIAVPLLRP